MQNATSGAVAPALRLQRASCESQPSISRPPWLPTLGRRLNDSSIKGGWLHLRPQQAITTTVAGREHRKRSIGSCSGCLPTVAGIQSCRILQGRVADPPDRFLALHDRRGIDPVSGLSGIDATPSAGSNARAGRRYRCRVLAECGTVGGHRVSLARGVSPCLTHPVKVDVSRTQAGAVAVALYWVVSALLSDDPSGTFS